MASAEDTEENSIGPLNAYKQQVITYLAGDAMQREKDAIGFAIAASSLISATDLMGRLGAEEELQALVARSGNKGLEKYTDAVQEVLRMKSEMIFTYTGEPMLTPKQQAATLLGVKEHEIKESKQNNFLAPMFESAMQSREEKLTR